LTVLRYFAAVGKDELEKRTMRR